MQHFREENAQFQQYSLAQKQYDKKRHVFLRRQKAHVVFLHTNPCQDKQNENHQPGSGEVADHMALSVDFLQTLEFYDLSFTQSFSLANDHLPLLENLGNRRDGGCSLFSALERRPVVERQRRLNHLQDLGDQKIANAPRDPEGHLLNFPLEQFIDLPEFQGIHRWADGDSIPRSDVTRRNPLRRVGGVQSLITHNLARIRHFQEFGDILPDRVCESLTPQPIRQFLRDSATHQLVKRTLRLHEGRRSVQFPIRFRLG